jgi:hypothetical protein
MVRCLVIQSIDFFFVVGGSAQFLFSPLQRRQFYTLSVVIALMVIDASAFLLTSRCVSTIF